MTDDMPRVLEYLDKRMDEVVAVLQELRTGQQQINARLDQTNERIDRVNDQLNERISQTNDRIIELKDQLNERIDQTNDRIYRVSWAAWIIAGAVSATLLGAVATLLIRTIFG